MAVRGLRGATTIEINSKEEILHKTKEMLEVLMERNSFKQEEIVSAIFSVTDDINANFPAVAAREIGWKYTPLLCTREIPVPGSLPFCIRVLLHVNSEITQEEMKHVYLHGAKKLRPDLED